MLNAKQKDYLRGLAQKIETRYLVGKEGVGKEQLKQFDNALTAKELIKIGVLTECPISVREVSNLVVKKCKCQVVQIIGRVIIVYRKSKTKANPIVLPK